MHDDDARGARPPDPVQLNVRRILRPCGHMHAQKVSASHVVVCPLWDQRLKGSHDGEEALEL